MEKEVSRGLLSLNLSNYVSKPSVGINWIPVVDFCVIGCLLGMISSQFLSSPGLSVDLPVNGQYGDFGGSVSSVMTIKNVGERNVIVYEGTIYSGIDEFRMLLLSNGDNAVQDGTILIKMDRKLPMEQLVLICEVLERLNYHQVQIAVASTSTE